MSEKDPETGRFLTGNKRGRDGLPAGRDADPRRGVIQAGKTWPGRDRRDPLQSNSSTS